MHHAPYGVDGYIEDVLFKHLVTPEEVAAVIVEPIQGEGGYIVPPAGWLARLQELCIAHGILFVADEIQSGIGRTGKLWAVEHEGIEPDVLLSGKGIASGMPLGALIARSDLMKWSAGAHGSTFGGNPVACAAAVATLDLVEGSLTDNAATVGELLMTRLRELQTQPAAAHRRARPRADDRHRLPRPRHRGRGRAGVLPARPARADLRRAGGAVRAGARRSVPTRPRPRCRSWPTRAPRSRPERRTSSRARPGCRSRSRRTAARSSTRTGTRYLDACSGAVAVNLGHGDPFVIDALGATSSRTVDSVHATTFTTDALETYAAELAPLVPVDDARIYPVSGGSEAIETACKLARAYHLARGDPTATSCSPGTARTTATPAARSTSRVATRCARRTSLARAHRARPGGVPVPGARSPARSTRRSSTRRSTHLGPERVAAFVAEPIGGATTGASVPPDDYWPLSRTSAGATACC